MEKTINFYNNQRYSFGEKYKSELKAEENFNNYNFNIYKYKNYISCFVEKYDISYEDLLSRNDRYYITMMIVTYCPLLIGFSNLDVIITLISLLLMISINIFLIIGILRNIGKINKVDIYFSNTTNVIIYFPLKQQEIYFSGKILYNGKSIMHQKYIITKK